MPAGNHGTARPDGFRLEALRFLSELSRNNRKAWFDANKERYESLVREPAMRFIAAMERPLRGVSPHFVAAPRKVGGSLMRPYRDVRFSKNKTPYKTNVGIQFRHEAGRDVHAPGFYVHISPDECFLGAGIWRPDSAALAAIRDTIDAEPKRWRRVRDAKRFREQWRLEGESLTRPPRGYSAEHPLVDDLKRKDHIARADLPHDDLFSGGLVDQVVDAFRRAKGYVGFLCGSLGLPF